MMTLHSAPVRGTTGPKKVGKHKRMENNKQGAESPDEATTGEHTERSYARHAVNNSIDFDPTKELNLPESYDEVLARFKRLQGNRSMESLN